jgi:hypothetical protein
MQDCHGRFVLLALYSTSSSDGHRFEIGLKGRAALDFRDCLRRSDWATRVCGGSGMQSLISRQVEIPHQLFVRLGMNYRLRHSLLARAKSRRS